MARLLKVAQLEARRAALAAESEVYRQTLMLEVQNLRLSGTRMTRRVRKMATPLIALLGPLAGVMAGRKAAREIKGDGKPRSLFANILLGIRLYKQFGPLIMSIIAQKFSGVGAEAAPEAEAEAEPEAGAPAANI